MGGVLLLSTVAAAVVVFGTAIAFSVGGEVTVNRWATLTAEDPNKSIKKIAVNS